MHQEDENFERMAILGPKEDYDEVNKEGGLLGDILKSCESISESVLDLFVAVTQSTVARGVIGFIFLCLVIYATSPPRQQTATKVPSMIYRDFQDSVIAPSSLLSLINSISQEALRKGSLSTIGIHPPESIAEGNIHVRFSFILTDRSVLIIAFHIPSSF